MSQSAFFTDGGSLNYRAVLEIAADVAKGMLHLHSLNIIHSDLKVSANWFRWNGGVDGDKSFRASTKISAI